MPGNLRIARIFGIDLEVHWSWLLVFWLITFTLATGLYKDMFPGWTDGRRWSVSVVASLAFFGSVALHEFSHSLVALRLRIPVKSITLFIFGGVSNLGREPDSARQEFIIAVVGPLTSLALGGLFGLIWFLGKGGTDTVVEGIFGYLAAINVLMGAFNLIPGYPLDGGRVFRSIVWGLNRNVLSATRIASLVGTGVAYLLMAAGVISLFAVGNLGGLWLVFIGWFLKNASEGSYADLLLQTTLHGVSAGDLMTTRYPTVPLEITLRQLVEGYVLPTGQRYFAVTTMGGEMVGLVTMADVKKAPPEKWDDTTVYRAMTPRDQLRSVPPEAPVLQVLQMMAAHDINQLPVMRGGECLGFITRGDILRFIQTRAELPQPPRI